MSNDPRHPRARDSQASPLCIVPELTRWSYCSRQSAQIQSREDDIVRVRTEMQTMQYDHGQAMQNSENEMIALRDLGCLRLQPVFHTSQFHHEIHSSACTSTLPMPGVVHRFVY